MWTSFLWILDSVFMGNPLTYCANDRLWIWTSVIQVIKNWESLAAHTHTLTHTLELGPAVHYQHTLIGVIEQLKYTGCEALRSIKSLVKLAAGSLTTISETSIFWEALQFLLIACKGRQQNLKNDCPHTEISPYRRQHLEDTHHSCWNRIVLNAFLKISKPSQGHYSTWVCQDEWVIDGLCVGNACIWDRWITGLRLELQKEVAVLPV